MIVSQDVKGAVIKVVRNHVAPGVKEVVIKDVRTRVTAVATDLANQGVPVVVERVVRAVITHV